MNNFLVKKNTWTMILMFIALPTLTKSNNTTIYIPPDYFALIVVGGIILFALILFKILKRSEIKNNRLKEMRRFNRHRKLERFQ
jgi:uncharacterized membrane protein